MSVRHGGNLAPYAVLASRAAGLSCSDRSGADQSCMTLPIDISRVQTYGEVEMGEGKGRQRKRERRGKVGEDCSKTKDIPSTQSSI